MGDEGGTVTSSLRGVRPDELFNIDPDATEEDLIRIRAMAADRPGLFRHAARGGENGTATSSQRGARYDEFCEPVHEEEGGAPFTSTYSRPHTSSAPPHTSSYSRPYSSSPTHESTRDKGHPHTPPASGPPFEVSARTLSTIVWYPCALVPGRSCNSMRDPPDIEDVLALAPTSVQELKIEPFEMVSTFNGYLNIDPESDSAMIDWATSRPLLLRDMLHMVVWQLGRGKSLRVSEQLVLQGICKCIIGCGKLITVVSKAQVSRLQSGVVGHGVDSAPGVNIEATIQLVDAALISSNEFIQSKDWDTFSWTEGSPNKMLARLIELSFNHELDFTALRKKFVQVVTVARSAGLIQRVGDPLHNEFVSRIHTYTSVVDLRDRLREHTVGDLPLRWQEPQNPRYRNRQGEANSNEGDGGDYSGYYPAEGGYGAYHPGGGNESLGRGGDRFTGGAGRFSGRGKGDGRGKGKGGDRPAGLIQPLKNMERIGRECSHLFGGKRPGPLVNPEGDGQYGLACWCCCMMQYGYEVEMSFGDYFRAHGTAPVGKYSTRPKPRNMVITHPEPMCPNAPYILRAEAGEDPAKQWMIETDPRDPFIEALEVALREKGKPPYRTPRDRPPRQPDRQ